MNTNIITRNIPNAITCLNILSGSLAVLALLHAQESWAGLTGMQWAWLLIAIAAAADFCGGLAARTLKAYSRLGAELDSLSDLVSFGLAPTVMAHQCIVLYGGEAWLAWLTPLIAVCGALRLARFNVSVCDNNHFTGLPIPANALFWVGFTARYADWQIMPAWLTACAIILTSWLVVSPLRLFTLKFSNLGLKGNVRRWLLIAAAPLLCLSTGLAGLMWTVVLYICLSIGQKEKA